MMIRIALGLTAAFVLAACGARAPLSPPENASLPVAPYGTSEESTSEQLLELETLAAPERSVELRLRSEERADDPFELPPE